MLVCYKRLRVAPSTWVDRLWSMAQQHVHNSVCMLHHILTKLRVSALLFAQSSCVWARGLCCGSYNASLKATNSPPRPVVHCRSAADRHNRLPTYCPFAASVASHLMCCRRRSRVADSKHLQRGDWGECACAMHAQRMHPPRRLSVHPAQHCLVLLKRAACGSAYCAGAGAAEACNCHAPATARP